jgi:hypothetical protein
LNLLGRELAILACVIGTTISVLGGQWIIMSVFDIKKTKLPIIKFLFIYVENLLFAFFVYTLSQGIFNSLNITNDFVSLFLKAGLFSVFYIILTVLKSKTKIGKINI